METTIIKMINLKKQTDFEVKEGEHFIISDPCYDTDEILDDRINEAMGCNFRVKAKSGTWVYDFNEDTKTLDMYELRSSFLVTEEGINSSIFDKIFYFGVDSGQVGVFLENSYRNDSLVEHIEFPDSSFNDMNGSLWYRACCEATCTLGDMGFVPNGFVTGTKYGDGVYPVGIKYVSGTDKVGYIRIITDDICEYCGKIDCECETCYDFGELLDDCICEYEDDLDD